MGWDGIILGEGGQGERGENLRGKKFPPFIYSLSYSNLPKINEISKLPT